MQLISKFPFQFHLWTCFLLLRFFFSVLQLLKYYLLVNIAQFIYFFKTQLSLNKNIIENYALLRLGYSLVTVQEQHKKKRKSLPSGCVVFLITAERSHHSSLRQISFRSSQVVASQVNVLRFIIPPLLKNYNILSALFSDCDLLATTFLR